MLAHALRNELFNVFLFLFHVKVCVDICLTICIYVHEFEINMFKPKYV